MQMSVCIEFTQRVSVLRPG